jgi:hypothetical protein
MRAFWQECRNGLHSVLPQAIELRRLRLFSDVYACTLGISLITSVLGTKCGLIPAFRAPQWMYGSRTISPLLAALFTTLGNSELTDGMQCLGTRTGSAEGPAILVSDSSSTILLLGIALMIVEGIRRYIANR